MRLITCDLPDGTAEAYVARPDSGTGPGVLFCMDAIGLRPRIAEMADRIASWGYVVFAPNVFYRSGTAAQTSPTSDLHAPGALDAYFGEVMGRMRAFTTEHALADLPVYLDTLQSLDGVTPGRVGVHGYCMGARLAIRAAGLSSDVAAVGGFHGGGLATDAPDSPHLALPNARAEFVFGHADNDPSMGPEAIDTLDRALAAAGLTAKAEVYPDAAHGYSMADTPRYQEAATERMFTELRALYGRTLGGS